MDYNPLNLEGLQQMKMLIDLCIKHGFSLQASPVLPLIDLLIDGCLQLKNILTDNTSSGKLESSLNAGVKELNCSDDLGNSKMIKISFEDQNLAVKDERLASLFSILANQISEIRSTLTQRAKLKHKGFLPGLWRDEVVTDLQLQDVQTKWWDIQSWLQDSVDEISKHKLGFGRQVRWHVQRKHNKQHVSKAKQPEMKIQKKAAAKRGYNQRKRRSGRWK